MRAQETIICRLVKRNPSYNASSSYLNFWVNFGERMGAVKTRLTNGLGPPNPTKKLAHWVNLLGQPLS